MKLLFWLVQILEPNLGSKWYICAEAGTILEKISLLVLEGSVS